MTADTLTPSKGQIVQQQVLDYLARQTEPVTGREIIDAIEPEADNDVFRALGQLVRAGQIVQSGMTRGGPRNGPMRLYLIAGGLNVTAAPVAAPLSGDVNNMVAADPEAALDTPSAPAVRRPAPGAGDPILAALARMPSAPRIQEATLHADRLGALVARLRAGDPLYHDPDIAAWLDDLKTLMEDCV